MKKPYINEFLTFIFVFIIVIVIFITNKPAVDPWRLKAYEAMLDDNPSLCGRDKYCLDHARYYKSVICIADMCGDTRRAGIINACAPQFGIKYTPEQNEKINIALCSMFDSPSASTRRAYLNLVVDEVEDEAVELGAYLMALRGSANDCIHYIKKYVGQYGPRWNFAWYRALSGCRILAKERSGKQEEKDFKTWVKVSSGRASCADIENQEMRQACSTAGSASPEPEYSLLW